MCPQWGLAHALAIVLTWCIQFPDNSASSLMFGTPLMHQGCCHLEHPLANKDFQLVDPLGVRIVWIRWA
jgi:hypothetical protein